MKRPMVITVVAILSLALVVGSCADDQEVETGFERCEAWVADMDEDCNYDFSSLIECSEWNDLCDDAIFSCLTSNTSCDQEGSVDNSGWGDCMNETNCGMQYYEAEGNDTIDNVAACSEWLETMTCGVYDFSTNTDCSIYESIPCDVSGYFVCLTENIICDETGVPDITGWEGCAYLIECA